VPGAGDALEKRRQLVGQHAEPTHSGVELELEASHAAGARGGGVEPVERLDARHDGLHVERERGVGVRTALYPAEHQHGLRDARAAQLRRFLDADHREGVAARVDERARRQQRPVPVGVGFHHGDHALVPGARADRAIVARQRAEVDLGPRPAARLALRRRPHALQSRGAFG